MTDVRLATRTKIEDDFVAAQSYLEARGWTDGLPVIPPAESLVAGMLATVSLAPQALLGVMEPLKGSVTVEKVAANAVMAGCAPEYFPVVVAAVRAVLQPQFHVGSTACTTGGAAPVVIASGPLAREIGVHAGTSCFGGNVRANATIGRALRLTMRNLGGAKPDGMEKSTHGWPGKISMCFAENEERSPWKPLRTHLGFAEDETVVTVLAVRGLHLITEATQETGRGVLETIAAAMRMMGNAIYYQRDVPSIVCLSPEQAREMDRDGLSKEDVAAYLFEHCRLPVGALRGRGYYRPGCWPDFIDEADDAAMVPVVSRPDLIWMTVAGGDGRHSTWMPAWNICEGASERVVR